MSMSLRKEKCDSSSSRQRDVIELIFMCDMVMLLLLLLLESAEVEEECSEGVADPAEVTRCLEPEGGRIMLSRWQRCSSGCTN